MIKNQYLFVLLIALTDQIADNTLILLSDFYYTGDCYSFGTSIILS